MPTLRFPNPGSDFDRMINTYRLLYEAFGEHKRYDLDEAVSVLIKHHQVSSSGAVGKEAVRRSTREDRSRDPLYNQLKMYSELYRMLGWIHPSPEKKLQFTNTLLGEYVAKEDTRSEQSKKLLQECLLGIAFPNPNTDNKGIERLRFFPLLLKLMSDLGGFAHRDEIITGLYTITDDSEPGLLDERVEIIENLRGNQEKRKEALKAVASHNGVQANTLKNYTRFPLGVIKSPHVNWAYPERKKGVYERSTQFYILTEDGRQQLRRFEGGVDIRARDIAQLSEEGRAYLVNVGFTAMLVRAGYKGASDDLLIWQRIKSQYPETGKIIGDHALETVYFSPYQQANHTDINRAASLYEEVIAQA